MKILIFSVAAIVGMYLTSRRFRHTLGRGQSSANKKATGDRNQAKNNSVDMIDEALKATDDPNEPARWVP